MEKESYRIILYSVFQRVLNYLQKLYYGRKSWIFKVQLLGIDEVESSIIALRNVLLRLLMIVNVLRNTMTIF